MLASLFLVLGLGIEIEGPDGKVHAPNCVIGIVGKDLEITVRLTKSAPNQKLTIVGGDKKGQEITTDSDGKANANIVIPSPKRIGLKTILFQKTNSSLRESDSNDNKKDTENKNEDEINIEIYFIAGTPKEVPSSANLKMAISLVDKAYEGNEKQLSTVELVHEISKNVNLNYNPLIHFEQIDAWKVPTTWTRGGASCISNSYFLKHVYDVLGLPGQFTTVAIYATPDNPTKARFDGVDAAKLIKSSRKGELEFYLVDERNTRGGRMGGYGGMNHYEGCLVHDFEGSRTYYPGGTHLALKDPNTVLTIFRCLVWARYDTKRQEWQVAEIIKNYQGGGLFRGGLFSSR